MSGHKKFATVGSDRLRALFHLGDSWLSLGWRQCLVMAKMTSLESRKKSPSQRTFLGSASSPFPIF